MKKLSKYILFIIMALFIMIMPTSAKEVNLSTLGDLVLKEESSARAFYVIGKYIFTDVYVKNNSLNIEDIMLAARSIKLLSTDGETNTSEAYKKMNIYTVSLYQDGWKFNNNLIGSSKLEDMAILDIEYIDYKKIKDVYIVTFQDDEGNEIEKQYVISGQKAISPKIEERDAFEFEGWFNGDDLFDLDTEDITSDITLKQKWRNKQFTVTFDKDSDEGQDITNQTIEYGKNASKPTPIPQKKGYEFLGWFKCTKEDCSTLENDEFDFTTSIKENIKLKAKWKQIKRIVNFKGIIDGKEDNRFFEGQNSVELTYPFKLELAQIPKTEQEGYKFLGWYDEIYPDTVIEKLTDRIFTNNETIIIGKWKINTYTVTFDSDGGSEIGDKVVNYNEKVGSPGNAHKDGEDAYNGYEFLGWFKCISTTDCSNVESETKAYDFDTPVTSDIKLKAKYKHVVYTNKMVNNFVDAIDNDDFSAVVEENTNILFNVINKDKSLSDNYEKVKNALNNVIKTQNVKDITLTFNDNQPQILTSTSNINNELVNLFKNLTGKEYSATKLEDFYEKEFTLTINLVSGYKNEEDEPADVYTVKFIHNFVKVHNQDELKTNLGKGKEIIVENWEGTITEPIEINYDVDIDFHNEEIESTITNSKYTFVIKSGKNVSIKDLNLTINALLPEEYSKEEKKALKVKNTVGIKVEEDASLTINNYHVKTKEQLNKDTLTIEGQSLNSATVPIDENAAIELHGTLFGSNINYDAEIYGSPAVLVAKDAQMNLLGLNKVKYIYNIKRVNNNTKKSSDTLNRVEDFEHYYKNYNNSYIVIVWYTANSTKLMFAYIYNEKLILPNAFNKEDGELYKVNGKSLANWTARHFDGEKTSEQLISEKLTKNETIYLYAIYK